MPTKINKTELDFLVAMSDLLLALRDVLHRMENQEMFLGEYQKAIKRIENKIDIITIQTTKSEFINGFQADF